MEIKVNTTIIRESQLLKVVQQQKCQVWQVERRGRMVRRRYRIIQILLAVSFTKTAGLVQAQLARHISASFGPFIRDNLSRNVVLILQVIIAILPSSILWAVWNQRRQLAVLIRIYVLLSYDDISGNAVTYKTRGDIHRITFTVHQTLNK